MKVVGIIVEYNPLHNGHLYHIQKVRELSKCDLLIAVMSGNFVQRGEPAIIDKWVRTKAALDAGVDLVLELPFVFTTQSATQFGQHAVDILALAGVDTIIFGSETNNLEELKEIASLSFNIDHFKANMKKGYSYPAVYGYMADSYGPNDILAISYLRALLKYPHIEALSIQRTTDYNNDEIDSPVCSALSIRKALKENRSLNSSTPMEEQLKNYPSPHLDDYYGYIRALLLTTPLKELSEIFLMDEGIESLMVKQAYSCSSFDDFMNNCISKRYTRSRIQRILCHLMLHNTKSDIKRLVEYDTLRVLGFSDQGRIYLKELQKKEIKVANHYTANLKQYRDIEYKAAVVYSMFMNEEMKHKICRSEIVGLNKDASSVKE